MKVIVILLMLGLSSAFVSMADAKTKGNKVKIDLKNVTSKGKARTAAPSRSPQPKLQGGSAQEKMRN
jgi:hypothetical protein